MATKYIDLEASKSKKIYSQERHEYIIPVAELDWIPAADVRPVEHAEWIMNDEFETVCSLCGNVVAFVSYPDRQWEFGNFCPNCGADMRKSVEIDKVEEERNESR